jgi:transposase
MARGSREVWAKRVAQWKASGLKAKEFARRQQVSEVSLKWWKWRLGADARRRSKKTTMSPLTFVEMTPAMQGEPLEVVLEGGARVRVPLDFDEATLARLLGVLERRR